MSRDEAAGGRELFAHVADTSVHGSIIKAPVGRLDRAIPTCRLTTARPCNQS